MAVDRVGSSNDAPLMRQTTREAQRAEKAVGEAPERADTARSEGRDYIEISEAAREAVHAERLAEKADSQEDVRPEKVELAKRILADGTYNQVGNLERAADGLESSIETEA